MKFTLHDTFNDPENPMKTHTPGPFPLKITQADDFFVIITNQGNHYAKTFDPAAAHLIASAPELLSALEFVSGILSQPVFRNDSIDFASSSIMRNDAKVALHHITNTIAKAKGSL